MEPFPGYRLQECLGQGGFGQVWRAEKPGGWPVALKFLPCAAGRSTREIRALQTVRHLRHPQLIRVDQVWCHLGYIIIAMELADASLEDLFDDCLLEGGKALDPWRVCYYLAQAAEGLDFLNKRQHM